MSGERDQAETIARWTDRMYGEHGAVHHVDIVSENTLYRVFLLSNTLQVDLSFWPSNDSELWVTGSVCCLVPHNRLRQRSCPPAQD